MQLKHSSTLAVAALSLLGTEHAFAAEWEQEASVLYYGESDGRVKDGSLKYTGTRTADNGDLLNLNVGIDTLTGASPSGVTTTNQIQTITSPSGHSNVTPAGELPLDNRFKDTRVSASVNWDHELKPDLRGNVGASFSKEYDYLHLGVNGGVSQALNDKNTILSAGFAISQDAVEAVGGTPTPLSDSNQRQGDEAKGSEDKTVTEVLLGVTQVFNKKLVGQFNIGISEDSGYLNDPYKYVSQVSPQGIVSTNLHESRPDSRSGQNLYGALKYKATDRLTSTSSARLHTDDWGVDSVTIDQKIRVDMGNKRSIEPHVRYYSQKAADFYTVQLNEQDPLPQYTTADYRLSELDAYTVGLTYRWEDKANREWRITGEMYKQEPTKQPLTAGQTDLNANPGFTAQMISLGLNF